jgi:hypothetical protein
MDEDAINDLIRDILNRDWDPIGIRDVPGAPNDEYDSYIDAVRRLIVAQLSRPEIVARLLEIERRGMRLTKVSRANAERTADALIELRSKLRGETK